MAAPPYQKFFWGSYHKHTPHLRHAREHGAYLLLLGALWNNGGKLPADDDVLAGYALLSPKEWEAVKPKLMPLFKVVRGKLTQPRVSEDLAKYESTSGKRKEAGKLGGLASAEKHKGNPSANAQASATVLPTKPEPEPYKSSEDKSSDGEAVARELNRTAWKAAVEVIMAPGDISETQARKFFGALLSEHGLEAKDLLPAISSAADNGTDSPRALLTKWAKGIAKRREPTAAPKRVGFV